MSEDGTRRAVTRPHDLLPQDRRDFILHHLRTHGSVRNTWLATALDVNPATIRRDMSALAVDGLLQPVRGGATVKHPAISLFADGDLRTKQGTNVAAKERIAAKAVSLIEPGDTIALNSGSTVEMIARLLPVDVRPITIVTLALNVASVVATMPDVRLIVCGGTLKDGSQAFIGPDAVDFVSRLRIDKGFFGVTSVDIERGWTHTDSLEVDTNRQLFDVCARRFLAADTSKFGLSAVWHIADLDEFDGLITEGGLDRDTVRWAQDTNTALL